MSLSVFAECVAAQAELLRLLLLAVDGAEERAAFAREHRLSRLGVAELATSMSVTPGFGDAA